MGPESVLILSLSILLIWGNSGILTNTVLAREIPLPDNGAILDEADPKVNSTASVPHVRRDITDPITQAVNDAITKVVRNAAGKAAAMVKQESDEVSEDDPVPSDYERVMSNANDNSKHPNTGKRKLSIREAKQEQSKVAYDDDDNEPEPHNSTGIFPNTPDAEKLEIERRFLNLLEGLTANLNISPSFTVNKDGVVLNRRNSESLSIYEEGSSEDYEDM